MDLEQAIGFAKHQMNPDKNGPHEIAAWQTLLAHIEEQAAEIRRHHADFERWETMADTAIKRAQVLEAELASLTTIQRSATLR